MVRSAQTICESFICPYSSNLNSSNLQVVSRYRDPQHHVGENYSDLTDFAILLIDVTADKT